MATAQMPVNPDVLKWARRFSGYETAGLQAEFRHIRAWEAGELQPTWSQLEQLARKFKVPAAVFFFPEPPNVTSPRNSFRTLPGARFDELPPKIHLLLRKAQVFQINLRELNDGQNPAKRRILQNWRLDPGLDTAGQARALRRHLKISLEDQRGWKDSTIAFDKWRDILEQHGIAVFKDAFREHGYSGFCLYADDFPVIYVNNSTSRARQIFTLFHELAHLLIGSSGITLAGYAPAAPHTPEGGQQRLEMQCNTLAAEFLLPEDEFQKESQKETRRQGTDRETAARIAGQYHVSRELVYRRFLDGGMIDASEYQAAAAEWAAQQRKPAKAAGGNPFHTRIAYLGKRYIRLAFAKYYQNHISRTQLAEYLGTKEQHLEKLEDYLPQTAG